MKWFKFDQNNSFGVFEVNDKVCHNIFIEAENYKEARKKALSLGIYFNGVYKGIDCPCCGDRWSDYEYVVKLPKLVNEYIPTHNNECIKKEITTIEDYAQFLADYYGWTKPDARIYYANGKILEIYSHNVL